MPIETVRADWLGERRFLLRDRSDFPIVMAQPMGAQGADLLPLSLIGCALWDIENILRKQRQALTALSAAAESARDEAPPWRFRRIHIHYTFRGRRLRASLVRRAIDLTETQYCSIFATLRDAVELTSDFEIVEEEPEPGVS